jgi:hypothetical protein
MTAIFGNWWGGVPFSISLGSPVLLDLSDQLEYMTMEDLYGLTVTNTSAKRVESYDKTVL